MDDVNELYSLFPQIKEHIHVEKKIGQGTFSYVYLGYLLKDPQEKLALKYIIPTSSPSRTRQEIDCLLNIGGTENVIGVLSVLRNKSHILILMPFIDNETFHESFLFWSVDEIKEYIRNLLIALNRVHQCGVIHRDVKPSNFLYDRKRKKYALVDFGLAQPYEKSSTENVFVYEKLNKKPTSSDNLNSSAKKNLIAINSNKSNSSRLMLTNTQQNRPTPVTPKNDVNSMPEGPKNNRLEMNTSQSLDRNLSSVDKLPDPTGSSVLTPKNNIGSLNQIKPKPSFSNFQKFHSFQKTSFLSESKCNCFNTQFVCDICTSRSNKWAPRAGTAGFRAPEILFRSSFQTPAIDVWSAGIIFLSLLSGRYPFFKAVDDTMAIMQLVSLFGVEPVRRGAFKYGECFLCSYENRATDLKEICVELRMSMKKGVREQKSRKRVSEKEIDSITTEFPDSAYDLLRKLLDIDCEKRLSAQEALKHPFFASQN